MNTCAFQLAWRGPCAAPTLETYCAEHSGRRCQCGAVATRECDATMGPLVCGVYICDVCKHESLGGLAFKHGPREL